MKQSGEEGVVEHSSPFPGTVSVPGRLSDRRTARLGRTRPGETSGALGGPRLANDKLSPRKQPVQERSRDLVEAVLEATRRLLVDEGFEALSMARIAKVAGVSPGSLYQYFPSVDSLLVVLYQRMRGRELEAFEEILASTQGMPLRPAVEALLYGLAGLLNTQRPLAAELAKWVPVLDLEEEKIAPIDRQVLGLMVTFLRDRTEETRPLDPEVAGMVLTRALLGVVRHALVEQPEVVGEKSFFDELVALAHGYMRRV